MAESRKVQVAVSLVDPVTQERLDRVADVFLFSAFRCFPMTGEADEIALANQLVHFVVQQGKPVLLHKIGPFLDFLLTHVPDLKSKVVAIIDAEAPDVTYQGIACLKDFSSFAHQPCVVLLCTLLTEERWRMEKSLPPHLIPVSPDMVKRLGQPIPSRAWIPEVQTIYPIDLPDIQFQPDMDMILLGLPSTYSAHQMPAGLAYVTKALNRANVRSQTFDYAIISYHRINIHQFYDVGGHPMTRNNYPVADIEQNRVWTDPRQWPALIDWFEDDISTIVRRLCAARPKIVGMSIHHNNEWIGRELARRIKRQSPDILIMIGGHSCYAPDFGRKAFPEADYIVVGEGDMVVGPLVEAIAKGERPKNQPGVVSVFDDADHDFIPGPVHHDLNFLGGLDFKIFDDMNAIYRSWEGHHTTAMPLTRGCVWSRCTFCAERFAFRTRTAENYVDELETFVKSGRGGTYQACDSDFGGNPDVIREICEEIVRRGLTVNFSGQIRANKKYDYEFFKLMKRAGIHTMNLGMDAVAPNLLRLQRKGYTTEVLLQNLEDCFRAGISPSTNFVIGIPHETEEDVTETLEIIRQNIKLFPIVHNVNTFDLVHNSIYWHEPEAHDIYFYGDKEKIMNTYYGGIPQHLWYSMNPFMDKEVRFNRVRQLTYGLSALGIPFTKAALKNFDFTMGAVSFLDGRNFTCDPTLSLEECKKVRLPPKPSLPHMTHFQDHLMVIQGDGHTLAVPYDAKLQQSLLNSRIPHWWNGQLH